MIGFGDDTARRRLQLVNRKMRVFTREELKKYDGSQGIAYVAYMGRVYDISNSFQ
jgi:hypothetical protein